MALVIAGSLEKLPPPELSEEKNRSTKKVKNKHDPDPGVRVDGGFNSSFKDDMMQEGTESEEEPFDQYDIEICSDHYKREKEDNLVRLHFTKEVQGKLDDRMNNTLIVRVLGKNIGFKILFNRMHLLWNPKGYMKVIDVDNGYYMVRFSSRDDYMNVLLKGPWTVSGHYLTVQPWTSSFNPIGNNLSAVAAWVRFPSLPAKYYPKNVLRVVAETVGEFIKIDYNTVSGQRGQFATCEAINSSRDGRLLNPAHHTVVSFATKTPNNPLSGEQTTRGGESFMMTRKLEYSGRPPDKKNGIVVKQVNKVKSIVAKAKGKSLVEDDIEMSCDESEAQGVDFHPSQELSTMDF
ncbi:hypothetical protein Scep_028122 [Stephania cephalantha]|uniref:DUF4283 domain-containing protein n=1 Tax=Stephania cephalantha TaxID=152367 RepID=A0AAP0HN65_9MAGN